MRLLRHIFIACATWCAATLAPSTAYASACMDAAAQAEARHGIPNKLLQAITLVETGRTYKNKYTPWPWTTNKDAQSHYFRSRTDGTRFVKQQLYAGAKSIDVGCFQINTRWHGEHFASIDDMFDPVAGAEYAARFLVKLKDEFGDWDTAATKYHSRTPVYAKRYGEKLAAARKTLAATKTETPAAVIVPPPPLREGSLNSSATLAGGVTLAIFATAQPLVTQASGPALVQGATLRDH